MNYPTPYGNSDSLALENTRLKKLVKELKQRPDPWTEVYECDISHEDPYDFDYCATHDRTFEEGGMCDHAGLSEIDYLTDREMGQRGRAVKAEALLEEIKWLAELAISAAEESPARMFNGEPFPAYVTAQEILEVIG